MAQPSDGLERMLNQYVFKFFLNDITEGALQISSESLFQTAGEL